MRSFFAYPPALHCGRVLSSTLLRSLLIILSLANGLFLMCLSSSTVFSYSTPSSTRNRYTTVYYSNSCRLGLGLSTTIGNGYCQTVWSPQMPGDEIAMATALGIRLDRRTRSVYSPVGCSHSHPFHSVLLCLVPASTRILIPYSIKLFHF